MQRVRKVKFQDVDTARTYWAGFRDRWNAEHPDDQVASHATDAQGRPFVHCWVNAKGEVKDSCYLVDSNPERVRDSFSDLKGRPVVVQLTDVCQCNVLNNVEHLMGSTGCAYSEAEDTRGNDGFYQHLAEAVERGRSWYEDPQSRCPECGHGPQWHNDPSGCTRMVEGWCPCTRVYEPEPADDPTCDACGEPVSNDETACSFYHGPNPKLAGTFSGRRVLNDYRTVTSRRRLTLSDGSIYEFTGDAVVGDDRGVRWDWRHRSPGEYDSHGAGSFDSMDEAMADALQHRC